MKNFLRALHPCAWSRHRLGLLGARLQLQTHSPSEELDDPPMMGPCVSPRHDTILFISTSGMYFPDTTRVPSPQDLGNRFYEWVVVDVDTIPSFLPARLEDLQVKARYPFSLLDWNVSDPWVGAKTRPSSAH